MPPAGAKATGRRLWVGMAILLTALVAVGAYALRTGGESASPANANDGTLVARGAQVYGEACASCHGAELEGQPGWRIRREDGRLPAPPHDETGHTWHHPDDQLFGMTKLGVGAFAGFEDYETDMPSFEGTLSDEDIWAVLAYIKSRWPAKIRARQEDVSRRAKGN